MVEKMHVDLVHCLPFLYTNYSNHECGRGLNSEAGGSELPIQVCEVKRLMNLFKQGIPGLIPL